MKNCNHNYLAPPCPALLETEITVESGEDSQVGAGHVRGEEDDGWLLQEADSSYSVSPGSLHPCPRPGYYSEETSCSQFYVCKEVAPGVLSANRVFR